MSTQRKRTVSRRPHKPPVRPQPWAWYWGQYVAAFRRSVESTQAALLDLGGSASALGRALADTMARWEAQDIIVRLPGGSWGLGPALTTATKESPDA